MSKSRPRADARNETSTVAILTMEANLMASIAHQSWPLFHTLAIAAAIALAGATSRTPAQMMNAIAVDKLIASTRTCSRTCPPPFQINRMLRPLLVLLRGQARPAGPSGHKDCGKWKSTKRPTSPVSCNPRRRPARGGGTRRTSHSAVSPQPELVRAKWALDLKKNLAIFCEAATGRDQGRSVANGNSTTSARGR